MAVAIVAFIFLKGTSDDYLKALPARPKALSSVDLPRLAKESGLGAEGLRNIFPQEWNDMKTGIDWTKKVYAFVSSKEYFGVLAAVKDGETLEEFLQERFTKGYCRPVEERQGYHWTILNERWMMGFNGHALLVMGPGLGGDMEILRQEILKCFRQEREESGMVSSVYEDLNRKEAAFAFVSQMDVLPTPYGETFRMGLPEHADLNDINVIATVRFTQDGVEISGEVNSVNPGINKYYEQLASVGGKMSGTYLGDVPANALAWGCANVDGDVLLEHLRDIPTVRTLLIGLNMGVDADQMIRSIQGDMAVALLAPDGLKDIDYLLTAQVEETDFLGEADYWLQSAAKNSSVELRDMGNHHYYMATGGLHAFFGVEDETLYVTSVEGMVPCADREKVNTLSAWKDEITDSRFFVWLNLEQLKKLPEIGALMMNQNGSSWIETVNLFRAVTLRSSDARHVDIKFHAKDNKHPLKELLEKWIR